MPHKSWRDHARPIIASVIAAYEGTEEKTLRKLISAEYPFGDRSNHPYKNWCDEVKRQLAYWRDGRPYKPAIVEQESVDGSLFEEVAP
jgi:hypothetical protein